MPVVCTTCHTENRDNAMFCRGCAGKLPAFAATGPSALESMRAAIPASMPPPFVDLPRTPPRGALRLPTTGWPVRVAAVGVALLLGLFAWRALQTDKPSVQPPAASPPVTAAAPAPAPAAAPAPAPATPPAPVPLDDSLSRGEAVVAPGPPPVAAAPPVAERAPGPRVQPPPVRAAVADPRIGCEHLNFVFAARCEAAHCDQTAYTRHPRCDLVREERRRDEARRNPTLGF